MTTMNPFSAVTNTFLYPLQGRLLAPVYYAIDDVCQLKCLFKKNTQDDCEKCIQAALRTLLSAGLFFAHRCVWNIGDHHFGPLGGLGCSVLLYQAAQQLDPRINYTSFSAWLLYKGAAGTLKHSGTNPWDSVCLLFLTDKKAEDFKISKIFESIPVRKMIKWIVPWILSKTPQDIENLIDREKN